MSYTGLTTEQKKIMLHAAGVGSIDGLFSDIPSDIMVEHISGLPEPHSEIEIENKINSIEASNRVFRKTFLGAGAYNHYIPPVVDEISSRSEFYTSYTPYQPEISQGTLASIFEFQTMMCMLTGLDITNASMYDGATSMAEAALMGIRTNQRSKVLVSRAVHPHYREALKTYAWASGFEVIEIPLKDGLTDFVRLSEMIDDNTSSVIIQNPNFLGFLEDIELLDRIVKQPVVKIAAVTEAMSMGLLKGPGECGADVVCGEVQSFGNALNFGGPYAGYIAVRSEFMRRMPGRLVGRTVDVAGNTAYTLTLQTREQHIRREKATSNICTNEGLIALRAAVYLSLIGVKLRDLAILNHNISDYLRSSLLNSGIQVPHKENPVFNEFVIRPASMNRFLTEFDKHNINPGLDISGYYPEYDGCILLCTTELITKDDADEYVAIVKEAAL